MNAVLALGPGEVNGLPAHVLLIHLTVVALPTAAAATVASAAWPAARRRLGVGTPLIALIALICVPITVSAGQWLYDRVHHNARIDRHYQLGHQLLPWAIALFLVAAIEYAWFQYGVPRLEAANGQTATRSGFGTTSLIAVVATVFALVVGVGSVVQVYRIGDSGARAA
jgi:hypothetical protein